MIAKPLQLFHPSNQQGTFLWTGQQTDVTTGKAKAEAAVDYWRRSGSVFFFASDSERTPSMNLDGTDQNDLWGLHKRLQQHPVIEARRLFPSRPRGYVAATRTLKNYAANKATAMGLRAEGKITTAITYEAICERLYDELPDFARW